MKKTQKSTNHNGLLLKGALVAGLVFVMLLPGCFVANLVEERQARQESVVAEVSSKWADSQTLTGPIILLPYTETTKLKDGTIKVTRSTAYILPDKLLIDGKITPTTKQRSLYRVSLYRAATTLSGSFSPLPLDELQLPTESILWNEARLVMGITDPRGIDEQVMLTWNGSQRALEAGVPRNALLKDGISVPIDIKPGMAIPFSLSINLKGSDKLFFTPVGKVTAANIASSWKDPAFDGHFLPNTTEISDTGFKAAWKVSPLSHNYPQYWKDNSQDFSDAVFGVRLIQTVDSYSKTNRSVKYAILFIALTFAFFFFLEILNNMPVHPIQYVLVGIALTVFYTLLLSISEYTGFNTAYGIAAVATILLIASYVHGIFKSKAITAGFGTVLTALYGYIFIIIQSEDYALLFGSVGLFVIMAIIMHYSRKVDWYGATEEGDEPAYVPCAMAHVHDMPNAAGGTNEQE